MTEAIPTPVDDLAIMVWGILAQYGELGRAVWEIQKYDLRELTKPQIKRGLDRINHVLAQTREQPLVYFRERGRGIVWKLPRHATDYQTFAMGRLRELLTRSHTELTRSEAALLRWPDDLPPYLPKMLHRVIEDLEDILTDMTEEQT